MLGDCALTAMVATARPDDAATFYRDVLGLRLVEDTPFAIVFDAGGRMFRVTKVQSFVPQPFSLLAWGVTGIDSVVMDLAVKGVTFERYEGLPQDNNGIWDAPGGARVAWFKDPDGNLLSVVEGA